MAQDSGGAGGGDPLDRATDAVVRDVRWGKVSVAAARGDDGVGLDGPAQAPVLDEDATRALRERLRAERPEQPFSDRGPGCARLGGGRTSSEIAWLV